MLQGLVCIFIFIRFCFNNFFLREIVAMDCARFGQSSKKAGVTEKEESTKDILVIVAELQNLNGFWELEARLADLLDCQLDKLKSAKPQKCEYTAQSLLNLLQ
ncbi:unnamed protein product [Schistocephalus solidus]|uniref:Uncharacterized protein n=1 Tax=Schistocephalus solidus TaxID=70667 RepID=A0A183SAQ7_SCHSO|nr:unnamed protein product [Schistocephalus solidus]